MNNKKDIILKNATNLFIKRGIKSVSMDDISRANSVSKKTLYIHFKNKFDLVDNCVEWLNNNPDFIFTQSNDENTNSIDEYIRFYIFVNNCLKQTSQQFHYDLEYFYPKIWEKYSQKRKYSFTKGIIKNIQKGIKEGIYRADINIEFIGKILVSFYLNTWKQELSVSTEIINIEYHKEITMYHLRGICNKKGIEYLEKNI